MSTKRLMYHPIKFFICDRLIYIRYMKNINDVVVDRLCKYLNDQNLTQYKLAQLSGVPFPTIKSIMQRRTKDINLKTIIMLADGLNISASEFLNDPSFSAENLELN